MTKPSAWGTQGSSTENIFFLATVNLPHVRRQMSSCGSVEIWHIILKFSISVPIFFDTDPLETHGVEIIPRYYYDHEYWESERSRNSLRRVCRAWNDFLQPCDYRFVRLIDVVLGHAPPISLSQAIRVALHEVGCDCLDFHDK